MKNTRIFRQDGKIVIHKQTDPNPVLDNVAALRQEENNRPGQDFWHIGRVDAHVFEMWVKEAGVSFDDREAVLEVLRRKLLSSDNAAFRVRQGAF